MLFKLMNSGSMSLNSLSRKRGKGTMFKDSPSQIFTIIEQSPVEFTRTEGVAECNDLILLACKSTHSLHMRTYTHTHTHTHTCRLYALHGKDGLLVQDGRSPSQLETSLLCPTARRLHLLQEKKFGKATIYYLSL